MRLTPQLIENQIAQLVNSPRNTLELREEAAFGMPAIGFMGGDDALFQVRKYENGEPGLKPLEWIEAKYGSGYALSELTVISWALPILEPIREKMRLEKYHPCIEWSLARNYGERFNRYMAGQLELFFEQKGVDAISPIANERIQRTRVEKYGLGPNWSERMAAYICGLGTLRASTGIITELGACVRLGSIIVAARLPRTVRSYASLYEYCLHDEGCTKCAERCPAGALSESGLDYGRCLKYQTMHILPYAKKEFGFDGLYACELCKTGVPCEACRPRREEEVDGQRMDQRISFG